MGISNVSFALRRGLVINRPRISALPARLDLALVVGCSFILRAVAGLGHVAPRYFPDEYIYASLARSISNGDGLRIRGGAAHFPAFLEPLLSSPLWLSESPEAAYRLTIIWHSLAMSLAAIPIFMLCRRLELSRLICLGGAAFAVALPSLRWAPYLTADAIAYPLALAAVYAVVATLVSPSRRTQVAMCVLCGAATLARVQYVVIPVVFLLAAIILEQGRVLAAVRKYRLACVIFAAPTLLVLVTGPSKVLGYYGAVTSLGVQPARIAHWAALDVVLLLVASGVVLAPAAIAGIAAAIGSPRSRAEASFGVVTVLFAATLLFEAALYASNGSARFQERYLMTLTPLLVPAFGLGISRARGWWTTLGVAAAVGILLFTARVPLTGYTIGDGKQDSPFLSAVYQLQTWTSSPTAASVVAFGAAALAALGALTLVRPRRPATAALAVALVVAALMSVASTAFDHVASQRARNTYSPGDQSWIDHAGVGRTDILALPHTPRSSTEAQLLWNTSLTDVLLMKGADEPDAFGSFGATIARDGTILKDGHPTSRPLVIEEYLGKASLQHAAMVRRTLMATLWRPTGEARLSWLLRGRYFDGWLASRSRLTVWPDSTGFVHGTLRLRLYLPRGIKGGVVITRPGGHPELVTVTGSRVRTVVLAINSAGPYTVRLDSPGLQFLPDGRDVSVRALPPQFARSLKPRAPAADRS